MKISRRSFLKTAAAIGSLALGGPARASGVRWQELHRLWEPLADKQKPIRSYGAKFSLPYSIAVMLVHGRAGLEQFTDEAIRNAEVLRLAARVRYELDASIDYPRHFSGHVNVFLDDGTLLEENQAHPRGGFEDPLPPSDIEAKFRANAKLALPMNRVEKVLDAVHHLEQLSSARELSDLLIQP